MIYKEEKKKSTENNSEMTQVIVLVVKNIRTVIINIFYMLKELKD